MRTLSYSLTGALVLAVLLLTGRPQGLGRTALSVGHASPSCSPACTDSPFVPNAASAQARTLRGTRVLIQPDGAAQPLQGAAAIAVLNEQRRANGIPALAESDASLASLWCPDEGAPGGPAPEDRDTSSVAQWDATMTPWDDAPAHQVSLYEPDFTAAGEVYAHGRSCLALAAPSAPPSSPGFFSYVSDGGRSLVPATETVSGELPYAPQQLVGLPAGRPTGPQLILYALGFPGERFADSDPSAAMRVVSWSLTGPGGRRVRGVRMVDHQVAGRAVPQGASIYDDAAIMIPPPLAPGARYTARVLWQGPMGLEERQEIPFSTGLSAGMSISGQGLGPTIHTRSPQPVQLSIRADGRLMQTALTPGSTSHSMGISYGTRYSICAYQEPGRGYSAAAECVTLYWEGTGAAPTVTISLSR
jgi:hypothetical protein